MLLEPEVRAHMFIVQGHPAPKGSVKFTRGNYAKPASPRLEAWTSAVRAAAMSYASSWPSFNESPLKVSIKFFMPMAKSWKEAKKDAYRFAPHAVPPDLDKLIRSTLDAMTGVCFRDDAVVASVFATKAWVPPGEAGARIIVSVF